MWMKAAAIFATALVTPRITPRIAVPRMAAANETYDISATSLADELERRGLTTALDDLAEDGPSAFKNPAKVIEYVMLSLQHAADDDGIKEAFRFTARPAGQSSFVSGLSLSSQRVSWSGSRFIGGYVSGKRTDLEAFTEELRTEYAWLLGCTQWRFSVLHPETFAPLYRDAERDFVREYVLSVDERPVSVMLFYDWGCWCYLIYKVTFLDDPVASAGLELGDSASRSEEGWEGRSSRARGGSL